MPTKVSKRGQGRGLPLDVRFWSNVVRGRTPSGCWEWSAGTDINGYGWIGNGRGKLDKGHRVSWRIHNGEIPEGMQVNHHCDSPSCTNPAHLYLGTQLDNMRDMVARGRQGDHAGTRNGRSRVDEFDVTAIRWMRARGLSRSVIARSFGVSKGAVGNIVMGRTWTHVP